MAFALAQVTNFATGQKTMANSLAVVLASDQSVVPVSVAGSVAVTGTFWQVTQPVSAVTLPLPTGAATETTLSGMSGKLPTTLGQKTGANSISVVLASDQGAVPVSQSGTWNLTNISGTVSLPTGASTEATLSAMSGKLPATLGQKTMVASLAVAIASDQGAVPVSGAFWQATQPVSIAATVTVVGNKTPADAAANPTDAQDVLAFLAGYNGTTWDRLRSTIANGLAVDVSRVQGTVAATQSGTWTMQPGNTANTTPWLVAGNVTPADAQANPTVDVPVSGYLMGYNGTTWDRVRTANTGRLQVDVVTGGGSNASVGTTGSAVPASATYAGMVVGANLTGLTGLALADAVANPTALQTGAFNMGWNGTTWDRLKSTTANGLAVDVTRVQGSVGVTGTFWQATQPISATQLPAALGQTTMAASLAVTLASNQSALAVSQSGIWTVQPGNTANTTPWLVAGNVTPADAAANPTANAPASAFLMGYNGTTWDRVRTANTGRLQVDIVTGGGSNASVGTVGSAVPASATAIGGTDGTNLRVPVVMNSTPVGTEYAMVVRLLGGGSGGTSSSFASAFPAVGTAAGGKVVSSTPTYTNGNMEGLTLDTSGNLRVSGTFTSSGAADVTGTGSLTALNSAVQVALAGNSGAALNITSGLVGTITPEVSFDGTVTWVATLFWLPQQGGGYVSAATVVNPGAANYVFYIPEGASHVRVRVSAFTSGSCTANVRATSNVNPIPLYASSAAAATQPAMVAQVGGWDGANLRALSVTSGGVLNVSAAQSGTWTVQPGNTANTTPWLVAGNVTPADAQANPTADIPASAYLMGYNGTTWDRLRSTTANGLAIDVTRVQGSVTVAQATAASLNAQVQGAAASGAAKVGNPVQVGAVFNTTQPTVTTGQAVEAQSTARGALIVATGVDAFAVNATQAGTWNVANISGTVSLPTGAATETTLAAMSAKLPATLGQKTMAAALAVSIASDQSAFPVSQSGTWNIGTVTTLTGITNPVTVIGNKTPADAFANPTDAQDVMGFLMGWNGTTWDRLKSTTANGLAVDVSRVQGTVAVTQSGTWTVQPGNTANTTPWLVAGNVTPADAQANPTNDVPVSGYLMGFNGTTWDRVRTANTGRLQVDIVTGGGSNASVSTTGSAVPASATYAGMIVGANLTGLTGAALADALANPTALQTGAFNMGWNGTTWDRLKSTTANGLAVDVTRVQGSVAVTGTFWQATQPVSSTQLPAALGQTTMAASLAVTIASNQSALSVTGATTAADAFANPTTLVTAGSFLMGYNGTTWDRVRTANTGRLQVDVVTGGGSNASVGTTGAAVPASGTYAGMNVAGNLVGLTGTGTALNTNVASYGGTATTLGQKVMASSIPVVLSSDQSAISTFNGTIDANNSSTATLGANAVFTGTGTDTFNFGSFVIQVFSNVSSAANGLSLQFSNDNTNWDETSSYTFTSGGNAFNVQGSLRARYFRIVYTNGGTIQGSFRLQTLFKTASVAGSVLELGDTLTTTTHAQSVRAVLSAKSVAGTSVADLQQATPADAFTTPTAALSAGAFLMGYNGTTWDRVRTANTGRLQVDVVTGGGSNASVGTIGSASPTSGTMIAGTDGTNLRAPIVLNTTPAGTEYALLVRMVGAAAGGTSSSFGAAFPASGTAAGFTDGTNMVAGFVGANNADAVAVRTANVLATNGYLMGYNGTTWDRVRTANTGRLQVDVVTGGGSNASVSATGSAVPASATFVGGTDGANLRALNVTAAGILNVLSGDQATSTSGTIAANGQAVTATLVAQKGVGFQLTGTWTGTIRIQGSVDNTNWYSLEAFQPNADGPETVTSSVTANGFWQVLNPQGFLYIRVTSTAWTSGTANVILSTNAVNPVFYGSDRENGTTVPTYGTMVAGSDGTNLRYLSVSTSGVLNVQGGVTPADAQANPTVDVPTSAFLMGFNGTTWDRLRSDGNSADAETVKTAGVLEVQSYMSVFNGTTWDRARGFAGNADAVGSPTLGLQGAAGFLFGYNGTTWDRVRTANTGRLQVDVVTGGGTNASVGATGSAPPASATLAGGSVTTAAPTYTTGQMSALSLDTAGNLRVLVTNTSAAITAPADAFANPTAAVNEQSFLMGFNGTTWDRVRTANTGRLQVDVITGGGGGASTGTVGAAFPTSATLSGADFNTTLPTFTNGQLAALQATARGELLVNISQGATAVAVKAASTPAAATDPSLVVSLAGANSATKIGDGTNNVAIKAASTAPAAADPALVVAVSPNTGTLNIKEAPSTGATLSSVASSASSVSLLASNANRRGAMIFNESTAILYVGFAATTSNTSYTVQVGPSGYYEVPAFYTGAISGVWAAANGNARLTEVTT